MSLQKFAAEYRLKLTKDGSAENIETVIDGRVGLGSRIYEHDSKTLGVLFMTDGRKPPRTGLFNTFRAACLEVGMTATQVGDDEGIFLFDPLNPKQARVAIKGIRAKAKKQISPEQRERLILAGAAYRANCPSTFSLEGLDLL